MYPRSSFSFWGNMRTYPRSGFRSGGTSGCTHFSFVPSMIGDGPNTVSESTVSNTELSEFFGAHWVPGSELSEFLSAYYLCAKANSPSFSQNSPSLPQNSVRLSEFSLPKQYSWNSIPPVSINDNAVYVYHPPENWSSRLRCSQLEAFWDPHDPLSISSGYFIASQRAQGSKKFILARTHEKIAPTRTKFSFSLEILILGLKISFSIENFNPRPCFSAAREGPWKLDFFNMASRDWFFSILGPSGLFTLQGKTSLASLMQP